MVIEIKKKSEEHGTFYVHNEEAEWIHLNLIMIITWLEMDRWFFFFFFYIYFSDYLQWTFLQVYL